MMGFWTPEEDRLLLHAVFTHGKKWNDVQAFVPHRSIQSIRNRFSRVDKSTTTPGRDVCTRCGQIQKGHECVEVWTPEEYEHARVFIAELEEYLRTA